MPRKKSTPSRCTADTIKPIYRRDRFFRAVCTMLGIHKELVRRYLPKKFLVKIDVDKARVISPVSVDKHLRERLADLVLEIPFKSGSGTFCVCIEQQTTGSFSPQRAMEYEQRAIKAIKKEKGEDHSVAVHTIVLKSGRLSDKQQTDLFAGFKPDEMQLAREALTT
ncbi:MAG: Rpn family recombination-promoting nuclease/putative transposase, partial [Chlamydiota bacterium]